MLVKVNPQANPNEIDITSNIKPVSDKITELKVGAIIPKVSTFFQCNRWIFNFLIVFLASRLPSLIKVITSSGLLIEWLKLFIPFIFIYALWKTYIRFFYNEQIWSEQIGILFVVENFISKIVNKFSKTYYLTSMIIVYYIWKSK